MKHINYRRFIIITCSLLFVVALPFGLRYLAINLKEGFPVDPKVETGSFARLHNAGIYDLSVDRNLSSIFFSNQDNLVILMDRDRRPRWERSFNDAPLQARISSCGSYLAVGTASGTLFFSSTDQDQRWEVELEDSVNHVGLSANGQWVVAGSGSPDQEQHKLSLYNQAGEMQWEVTVASLTRVFISGEHPEQGRIIINQVKKNKSIISIFNLQGEELWSYEHVELANISRGSGRLAAVGKDHLQIYNFAGELLWENTVPFSINTVVFNPQNFNVLVFGKSEGARENLYYYSLDGRLLWRKRIADGSLISFTADGGTIITSSWRHYKEDYTQVIVMEESGREVNRWEVALRVERLISSGNERYILLTGQDGYIDVIDLKNGIVAQERQFMPVPIYRPATDTSTLGEDAAVTLYFSDDNAYPVPVSRIISQSDNLLRAALEEFIKGPARESSLFRVVPKDVAIELSLDQENGRLYLDLPPELVSVPGSAHSTLVIDSLLLTFSGFPEVREIVFTLENEPLEIFGDGLFLDQPFLTHTWEQPVFIPIRSGERYYLVPRETKNVYGEQEDLLGILDSVVRSARKFDFVPDDLRIISARKTTGGVEINLSRSAIVLFPDVADGNRRLLAALFLDALFLTAFENSSTNRVTVLVEGERWTPPRDYPALNRTFTHQYIINPEG